MVAVLCLSFGNIAIANSLNIGMPTDRIGPGSFFSGQASLCCSKELGFVFDVHETFSISSVGLSAGVNGTMSVGVNIYETALVPFEQLPSARGSLLASASATALGIDPWQFSSSPYSQHYYFDVPIQFTFVSGHRYELVFPAFSIANGVPVDANNWMYVGAMYLNRPDPGWAGYTYGPYDIGEYLTVIDGTLRGGSYTAIPFARLNTNNQVPEPSSLLLLGIGLAAVGGWRLRRKS